MPSPVRLKRQLQPNRDRARRLLKLQTRPSLDFDPETKRLLAEAKAVNFGKPVKVAAVRKKTQRQELQEAKERLMDAVPSKREQKLIDGYERRAVEHEKSGNVAEAAFQRQQAEIVRKNCIAIREVFTDSIARHEKEIFENLSKPVAVIRADRKAREAAKAEKMRAIMKKKQETMERNRQ